ncbi:MAG: dTMP kinase [Sulfuritalea sp.]|nr:dTMP kinase [Sulfuritalea sp.]MDP1983280.1 dTMP kinase [Sulfuritalea sp.]
MKVAKLSVVEDNETSESGHLFVFEGPDGVGKSSLVSELTTRFRSDGQEVMALSFPGQQPGTIGRHVYDLHHAPDNYGIGAMSPTSLQLLHVAAHIDQIERIILPALHEGRTVLLDRYWWSTWVYGLRSDVAADQLNLMINVEQLAWKGTRPSTLFLLQRDAAHVNVAIHRAYRVLAEKETASCPIVKVDNASSVASMVQKVAIIIAECQSKSLSPCLHPLESTS